MKTITLLLSWLLLPLAVMAQHTVKIRNLWAKPQVHVLFEGYTVSFTIKDINKTLALLAEMGDSTYGLSCGLKEDKEYTIDLHRGTGVEYHYELQPMLQRDVAAFLLTAGHAVVKRKRKKPLKEIIVDVALPSIGENDVLVNVYDPRYNQLVFQGRMKIDLYNKDLGLY